MGLAGFIVEDCVETQGFASEADSGRNQVRKKGKAVKGIVFYISKLELARPYLQCLSMRRELADQGVEIIMQRQPVQYHYKLLHPATNTQVRMPQDASMNMFAIEDGLADLPGLPDSPALQDADLETEGAPREVVAAPKQ